MLADWSTRGPSLVVFTRSADGALARLPSGLEVGVGGIDVEVVDTIGAGDTFTAGLLHALDEAGLLNISALAQLTAEQVEEALRFAVLVSRSPAPAPDPTRPTSPTCQPSATTATTAAPPSE